MIKILQHLYLNQAKAHTQTYTDKPTHAQNTTTIYSKRRSKETVEKLKKFL